MKKLLALSLAVVMVLAVSVTAFGAWAITGTEPSEELNANALTASAGWTPSTTNPASNSVGHLTPGDSLEIPYSLFVNTSAAYSAIASAAANENFGKYSTFDAALNAGVRVGTYSISYSFSSPSKSAIDSVKFDEDEGVVVITLKENYTMSANTLSGNIELKPKSTVSSGIRYTYKLNFGKTAATSDAYTVTLPKTTGALTQYTLNTTYGYPVYKSSGDDADLVYNYDDEKDAVGADFITNWGTASGTAKISWGAFSNTENSQYDDPDFYFEVKVNSSGKMNLSYSTKVVKDLSQKYESADLDFISFPAAPSFDYTGTAKFFTDDEKYIYEIKDGGLVAVNVTYDDDEGSYSWKTRTLGSYVISDVELDTTTTVSSDSDGDTTNPDTGANDFVNVAVALAVVSLAAAGAVVLKKK